MYIVLKEVKNRQVSCKILSHYLYQKKNINIINFATGEVPRKRENSKTITLFAVTITRIFMHLPEKILCRNSL